MHFEFHERNVQKLHIEHCTVRMSSYIFYCDPSGTEVLVGANIIGLYYHICCISSRLGKLRSEKREERALVVQARKKKNACYFLGVGSKQGRLDLILPKF